MNTKLISYVLSLFAASVLAVAALQRNAPYVPTPPAVVNAMLELAQINKNDVVYDLGCGDGRIVIEASKQYGSRGVGIDIMPQRIQEAMENAKREGVQNLVKFERADLYQTDLKDATVVMLYLLPDMNLKLRPKLRSELRSGARIVSHNFDMGDWKPVKQRIVAGSRIYLWNVRKGY